MQLNLYTVIFELRYNKRSHLEYFPVSLFSLSQKSSLHQNDNLQQKRKQNIDEVILNSLQIVCGYLRRLETNRETVSNTYCDIFNDT